MNELIKEQWIKDLESGEFTQCTLVLHNDVGGYCCLGVLCEQYIREHPEEQGWNLNLSGEYELLSEYEVLPKCVQKWAGLNDPNPNIEPPEESILIHSTTLAELNDGHTPFTKIAQLIREQL